MSRLANSLDGDYRRKVIILGILPAIGTIALMLAAYGLIGVIIFLRQDLLEFSYIRLAGLGLILVVPHLITGFLVGGQYGISIGAMIVISLSPIFLLELMIFVFGGPIFELFDTLWIPAFAAIGWMTIAMVGMLVGAKFTAETSRGGPSI